MKKFDLMVASLKRDLVANDIDKMFNDEHLLILANTIKVESNDSEEIYDTIISLEGVKSLDVLTIDEILSVPEIKIIAEKIGNLDFYKNPKDKNIFMELNGKLTTVVVKLIIDKRKKEA